MQLVVNKRRRLHDQSLQSPQHLAAPLTHAQLFHQAWHACPQAQTQPTQPVQPAQPSRRTAAGGSRLHVKIADLAAVRADAGPVCNLLHWHEKARDGGAAGWNAGPVHTGEFLRVGQIG